MNDENTIAARAWEWLDVLEDDSSPQVRGQFAGWLAESPKHVEEFLFASALHREFDGFDGQKRLDIDSLLVDARSNVIALGDGEEKKASHASPIYTQQQPLPSSRRMKIKLAIAASVVIAVAGIWFAAAYPWWYGYSTSPGEQRAFDLDDGSVVHLNTGSRLKVRYSAGGRDLELAQGEALFIVAKDAGRPFRVRAAAAVIEAVGTQFSVYRRLKETQVAVLQGSVRVKSKEDPKDAPVLKAGEGVKISSQGAVGRREAVNAEKVYAWRQRRLVFQEDALTDVVAEFNRYNSRTRLRIEGEGLTNKKLTGVFDADNPELLLQFLRSDEAVEIQRDDNGVVIRAR